MEKTTEIKKSIVKPIILGIVAIVAVMIMFGSFNYNKRNQTALILQFGQVVSVKEDTGIYFTIPFIQSSKVIYTGYQLYDMEASDVITSDKKTMIADCYTTWRITDAKKYYQNAASATVAESRINTAVYNAVKNVISSISQTDVISGKDGTLGTTILNKVTSLSNYGIELVRVEMKALDLPDDNKDAVYQRMISERAVIAAEYTANGEKEYALIVSETDAEVRTIISNAEVEAAEIEAEGEALYFQTLSEAYSTEKRAEFYNYITGLETLKTSLANGGTIAIDETSPLYQILINEATGSNDENSSE